MSYVIDPQKCSACAACVKECPMEAITGDGKGSYRILPDRCTDCGSCADVCPEEAIQGS